MAEILFVEGFYDGSHRELIDLLHRQLESRSILVTLPGQKWPWRARCSALILSQLIPEHSYRYLFTSSIVNLSELLSLRRDLRSAKTILYFHENDFIYPKQNSEREQRDFQFGYNQILSALVADLCLFNSHFNRRTFLEQLGPFLHRIPSPKPDVEQIRTKIEKKSRVLYFPLARSVIDSSIDEKSDRLTIIWPHRWEHDKDPETFFSVILQLYRTYALKFSLIILGQSFGEYPTIFDEIRSLLPADYIRHWGYTASKQDYEQLLLEGDVVVSTAQHEFYGVAMLEACRAGCIPLVPDRLVYPELYPNEQHRYRTPAQLLKKLREYCLNPTYVRTRAPRLDTSPFEWHRNEQLRQDYQHLFQHLHPHSTQTDIEIDGKDENKSDQQ